MSVCACGHEKAAHQVIVEDRQPPWCSECECAAYTPVLPRKGMS